MRAILMILVLFLLEMTAFGTVQYPDKIIYNGKEYRLKDCYPLESYFEKYPDKRPKDGLSLTALRKGYVATFEIIDNQLYLKDIEVFNGDTTNDKGHAVFLWKSVLNEVFPNQELIKMDWITGLLLLSYNEGIDGRYAHFTLLEIENGEIKKEKPIGDYKECREFKEKQFQAFKETEEYEERKAELKKDKSFKNKQDIDSFLRSFIIQYSSKILVE